VLFVFGIAAAEVAIGLGIIVVIFRLRESIDV
jgi:NADH:ubiquinone oxidoreductase subunit K